MNKLKKALMIGLTTLSVGVPAALYTNLKNKIQAEITNLYEDNIKNEELLNMLLDQFDIERDDDDFILDDLLNHFLDRDT